MELLSAKHWHCKIVYRDRTLLTLSNDTS
uniref:Uncharacterized protein n=1 Tax=Anguilla anguilla TaxID=7936 RepID=A0A0E9VP93_ANGAN